MTANPHNSGYYNFELKDSGERQEFSTGAVRDSASDKPALVLISPWFLWDLGFWLKRGATKYAPRNWEQGMPFSRVLGSLEDHVQQYKMRDAAEDHLSAIACNAMFLKHYEHMIARGVLPASLNDLPSYQPSQPAEKETP